MADILKFAGEVERDTRMNLEALVQNPQCIEQYITTAHKNVSILDTKIKTGVLNVGSKRKLESRIRLITGYIRKMKDLRNPAGGNKSQTASKSIGLKWDDLNSAFKSRIQTGVITNLSHKHPIEFLNEAKVLFVSKVEEVLKIHHMLKINVVLCCEFTKLPADDTDLKYFNTPNVPIDATTHLLELWDEHMQSKILKKFEDFQERGSGWSLISVENLAVNINKHDPLVGSSYISLPQNIAAKTACINVENKDEACFAWAVLSALHPVERNTNRTSAYKKYYHELNLEGITFPMSLNQVNKFEKSNNVSINVFALEPSEKEHKVITVLLTKNQKKDRHINLLMLQDMSKKDEPVKSHFCWIKNLGRLIKSQLTVRSNKIFICDRCLHYFYTMDILRRHETDCSKITDCPPAMPKEGDVVKFINFNNKEKVPFIIYLDLECLLKPINVECSKKSVKYQEHEAFSLGYYLKCSYDDSISYYRNYRGQDCVKWFVRELQQLVEDIEPVFWVEHPMTLTSDDEHEFQSATVCHICNKPFYYNNNKVRDHNHITGKFRGAAHKSCNVTYKHSRNIPVVCHNLTGYDSHFLISDIAQEIKGSLFLLPLNKESYISFTKSIEGSKIKFKFIDSFRFLPYSLNELASYLDDELKIMRSEYQCDKQFSLLKRKGVFPYDYIKCFDNLTEPNLPDKSKFYNELNESEISDDDYEHATNVWNAFNIQTLGEYSDLYLKTDVLLLADIFENFRETCFKTYGLDSAHYISAPGLTWDAMLKYTDIELDLITDYDMVMFVERGIRGGISQCSNRYAKANNRYVPDYAPEEPDTYLQYYDVNNLYGWAMSEYLPCGQFKWSPNLLLDVNQIPNDHHSGYILEVDLEYPVSLHDEHNDLPLCPEHKTPPGSKEKKLLTTLYDKERYVIHYRALKQALKHGLIIKKIHRVLEFKQSAWMKPYIELNTQMRTRAKNDFEKTFYKLMNNAAFGKTMENVRKYKTVKLVSKWDGRYSAKVLIAKPNFHSRTILSENLVLVELNNTIVKMNKPIYVGMCVLDISKTKLYDFHYEYMKPNFKCKVLYCDTDSLIYQIWCSDIYEYIKRDIDRFDTSDFEFDNPYGIPLENKKVPGLMKDENAGKPMQEFVGLRSKMYSMKVKGEDDPIKKAKGVKRNVVKNNISFSDYIACLENNGIVLKKQNTIRSRGHKVFSIRQTKKALSANDDKRKLLPGQSDTLAWGHCKIVTE